MIIKDIRIQNLNYWADKLGRDVIAEKAGMDGQNYINQLCTGHGSFGSRTARKIEEALDLSEGWLDQVHAANIDNNSVEEGNENAYQVKTSQVPLISWVSAGTWCESPDNYAPGDAEDWLDCPFPHSDGSFCLKVIGDSMYPEYREGEYILVDPEEIAQHGDDVITRTSENSYTFKRLQITPEGTYLLALNVDHPERKIKIPSESHICGVVTGSWINRKRR